MMYQDVDYVCTFLELVYYIRVVHYYIATNIIILLYSVLILLLLGPFFCYTYTIYIVIHRLYPFYRCIQI